MGHLEYLRQKLYEVMDCGDINHIIHISQELDKVILDFMKSEAHSSKKPA